MLKYEGFVIGDYIRAYDFKGTSDHFIEGVIVEVNPIEMQFKCYKIVVEKDESFDVGYRNNRMEIGRVGMKVYVPMEVNFFEWDGRVVKVKKS